MNEAMLIVATPDVRDDLPSAAVTSTCPDGTIAGGWAPKIGCCSGQMRPSAATHRDGVLDAPALNYGGLGPHPGLAQATPIAVDGQVACAIGGSRLNALPPGQGRRRRDRP